LGRGAPTVWEFRQVLFSGTARWRGLACAAIALALAVPPARADDAPITDEVEVSDEAEAPEPAADEPAAEETEAAEAETESAWSSVGIKVFDVAVVRPLGAVATVTGLAFFAISAPLVAPSGNIPVAWEVFFLGPYEYTFVRPLGDL
jgi:hypothetical protein